MEGLLEKARKLVDAHWIEEAETLYGMKYLTYQAKSYLCTKIHKERKSR